MERSSALGELIARITPENVLKPIFEELVDAERWQPISDGASTTVSNPGAPLGRAEP